MEYKIGMCLNIALIGILILIGSMLGAMQLFITLFLLFTVYIIGSFVKMDCASIGFKVLLIVLAVIFIF